MPDANFIPYETVQRLVRARHFITTHACKRLDLNQIARQAFLSPHHFHRLYTLLYGETPHDTLRSLRLQRAQYLLAHSSLPVREICWEIGYESVGSFYSLFARHTGTTPLQWRKQAPRPVSLFFPAPNLFIPACFLLKFGLRRLQITGQ